MGRALNFRPKTPLFDGEKNNFNFIFISKNPILGLFLNAESRKIKPSFKLYSRTVGAK